MGLSFPRKIAAFFELKGAAIRDALRGIERPHFASQQVRRRAQTRLDEAQAGRARPTWPTARGGLLVAARALPLLGVDRDEEFQLQKTRLAEAIDIPQLFSLLEGVSYHRRPTHDDRSTQRSRPLNPIGPTCRPTDPAVHSSLSRALFVDGI